MQTIAHLEIDGQKIKVLVRLSSWKATHVTLKLRKSGEDGVLLSDESEYLKVDREKLDNLQAGKVVKC
mgnify:CR=1 FL=1